MFQFALGWGKHIQIKGCANFWGAMFPCMLLSARVDIVNQSKRLNLQISLRRLWTFQVCLLALLRNMCCKWSLDLQVFPKVDMNSNLIMQTGNSSGAVEGNQRKWKEGEDTIYKKGWGEIKYWEGKREKTASRLINKWLWTKNEQNLLIYLSWSSKSF